MIGDLGLERRTKPREAAPYSTMDPEAPRAITNEERRILVGAWYMGSNAALSFNKLDSPRYTKHHDQCLNELKDAAEYETDELLIQLVRIQHLTERIFQFNHRDQFLVESIGLALPETTAAAHLSAFQAELDQLQNSLSKKLKTNSPPFVPRPLLDAEAFTRYHNALSALRSWVDNWLAIPVCYYFYMPQPGYGQLMYAVTMLARQARLSLLANAQLNRASYISSHASADTTQRVTKNIDAGATETLVLNALETFATRFEAAREEIGTAYGQVWENNLYNLIAKTLRVKRARIENWSKVLLAATTDGCSGDGVPPGQEWPAFSSAEGQESSTDARDAAEWFFGQLDRALLDDNYQESWLWGSDPLGLLCTDQGNILEEAVRTGNNSLPNTGIDYQ
ncbi:hypothetical protein N7451_007180 [Penicillium sp. IBT 35674x]|nr:hypothetical protein N7451_007180 [Penicillium sp. IBT 35674x]